MQETTRGGSLYAAIAAALSRAPDTIVLEADGEHLTASLLLERVGRMASALSDLGVRHGDRVVVQAEKSLAQVVLYLAVLRAGAAHVPLNTAYRSAEVAYFLGDAAPRLAVCDPERAAEFAPLAAASGTTLATLDRAGHGTLADACDAVRGPPVAPTPVADTDLASVIYTSGTTGRSKGAMLSHANLLANARALATAWGITAADRLLHALPLFHIHGLFVALNPLLLAGARVRLLPAFDADATLDGFAWATLFMGVPTHYTRLLAHPRLGRPTTAGMRLFVCGSAPLLPQTFVDFEAATGHRVLERYGMSECGIICSNPLLGKRLPGSVGPPLPGVELRLVDESGRPVPARATGVIEVRGPNVFQGYWRNPEKTAEELHADGFFVTGDVGRIDAAGYVHIVGRAKDLVISGGLNVYPKEVEAVLDGLPGVAESAVIGLPHPDFGEAVAAVVCALAGAPAPEAAALIAAAREQLAAFKVPKVVFLVAELPRNAMGKVQKAELRRRYAATFMGR
jgi:malonyl-CoA/methylmalonyl-CoA synthetase